MKVFKSDQVWFLCKVKKKKGFFFALCYVFPGGYLAILIQFPLFIVLYPLSLGLIGEDDVSKTI